MEKFISKGFNTMNELASFLNERKLTRDNIIYVGPDVNGNGYVLLVCR